MYIFLDETKRIKWENWEFILWWLVTSLKPWKVDEIYKEFLEYSGIKEKWWEIKSYDRSNRWKIESFYYYLKFSKYWNLFEFVWIFAKWYKESWKNYYKTLEELLKHTFEYTLINKDSFQKVNIIADNLKLDIKQENIRNSINELKLNKKWFSFTFENSIKFWWLKFADFIVWLLRKKYILEINDNYIDFMECFVNKEIVFIKLK